MESNFNALSYATGIDYSPYFAIAARRQEYEEEFGIYGWLGPIILAIESAIANKIIFS